MAGTGAAVPSDAILDLKENARGLDQLVNSVGSTFFGRATPSYPNGKELLTIKGMNEAATTGNPAVGAAQSALDYKNEAQLYAEAAATNADWVYPDVASGEAARIDGDYFWVVSADNSEVLELWLMGASTATDTGKRTIAKIYVDQVTNQVFENAIQFGDFVGGDPEVRGGSSVVELTDQHGLLLRGYKKAINQRIGSEFVIYDAGKDLTNKFVFGCYIEYSENPNNLFEFPVLLGRSDSGSATEVSGRNVGYIVLSESSRLVWRTVLLSEAGATGILLGQSQQPVDNTRFMTGFFACVFDEEPDAREILNHVLISDKARYESVRNNPDLSQIESNISALDQKAADLELFSNDDAFIRKESKNLFIVENIVDGKYLNNDGIIQSASGWGMSQYIPVTAGQQYTISGSRGRQGVAFFSSDDTNIPISGSYNPSEDSPLTVTAPSGANFIVINLYSASNPSYSKVQVEEGDVATSYEQGYEGVKVFVDRERVAPNSAGSLLKLNETEDSFIEAAHQDSKVKRTFDPFPKHDITSYPVFNFKDDYIDDVLVRSGGDDVAPVHALDLTIAANHGYFMGTYTAPAHGKTDADVGAIYSDGTNDLVILGVPGPNVIFIAQRNSNSVSPIGTFNYVSGGSSNSDIVATDVRADQWYPPFNNRLLKIYVDGVAVDKVAAEFNYSDKVVIVESYDVLERSDIIEWVIANNSFDYVSANDVGDPAFTMTNSYEFDVDGNCTIYQDWLFLKAIPFSDIMGVQASRSIFDRYYVPKTLPFTHEGFPVDYANIESATVTIDNGLNSVNFDVATQCEPTGLLVDRVVALTPQDNCFAMGFLPVQDTGVTERRNNVTEFAMEIRGNTGKIYPRVVEKGDFTTSVGEYYSTIAYRNVFPKPAERTTAYPVRTRGADYFYCDWHNTVKFDRIELPTDYAGRDFEVVEARNATLYNSGLTGSIAVDVSCSGDYAYLILKVAK